MSDAHFHSAGDTESSVPLKLSPLQTQPVLLFALWVTLSQTAAAVLVARRHAIAGVLLAVSAVLTGIAGALTRTLVTPMGRPRDNDGDPLTPLAASEGDQLEPSESDEYRG